MSGLDLLARTGREPGIYLVYVWWGGKAVADGGTFQFHFAGAFRAVEVNREHVRAGNGFDQDIAGAIVDELEVHTGVEHGGVKAHRLAVRLVPTHPVGVLVALCYLHTAP